MFFDVVSDLHIHDEDQLNFILDKMRKSKSEYLIVTGDTSDNINLSLNLNTIFSNYYDKVFFIPGNHDHYQSSIEDVDTILQSTTYFNTKHRFDIIGDTVIIGFTGWYDLMCYSDIGISFDTAKYYWELIQRDSKWINFTKMPWLIANEQKKELVNLVNVFNNDDSIKNIIIMTHMIPSKDFVELRNDPSWDNATPSYVNSFMVDEVSEQNTNNKIKLWVYGHTHDRANFVYKDIQFINNARGYGFETYSWNIESIKI